MGTTRALKRYLVGVALALGGMNGSLCVLCTSAFGAVTQAVGDFNGDGKANLAMSNTNSDIVSILLGDGAGGFGAPTNCPILATDVNDDREFADTNASQEQVVFPDVD